MQKGMLTMLMALVLAGAFFMAQTTVLAGTEGVPGPVKINHETKKGTVTFDHATHTSASCKACHHKGTQKKCFECHKAEKDGDTIDNKTAMHKSCKGCHKKEKKGPTKCGECHK